MTRIAQINLIASLALLSWLAMQAVHEFGHVAGAWLTGGQVERVVPPCAAESETRAQAAP
jgi:hypothetical protein